MKMKVADIIKKIQDTKEISEKIKILNKYKNYKALKKALFINYSDTDYLKGVDISFYHGMAPVSLPSQEEIFESAKNMYKRNEIALRRFFSVIDRKDADLIKKVLNKKLDLGMNKKIIFSIFEKR